LLYPAGAPEGDNVGVIFLLDDFANQTVFTDQEAGMFQVLGDVLQTSTLYTLALDIGNIANAAPPNNFEFGGFPGYRVELRAGGQVLGFDQNGVLPAEGEFVATSVQVEIGATHVQAGQPLEIRLINLNTDVGIEVNFDDLQLTATALPTCQYDLGFGGPGDLQLSVCGETLDDPSNSAELLLTGVEPFGQIGLILGLAANPVPFVGGTLAPFPVLRVVVVRADATGVLSVPLSGLTGPFVTLIIQALAVDGGGAYELSNALQLAFGDHDPLAGLGPVSLEEGGFMFTEGPLWLPDTDELLFTDIPADSIFRLAAGSTSLARGPNGTFANGLFFDGAGNVVACEHGNGHQHVTQLDGNLQEQSVLAATWQGQVLNSPNDGVLHEAGSLYFTDPDFGTLPGFGGAQLVLGFRGVYRLPPGGPLELIDDTIDEPNGIGLSPDQRTLYVSDTTTGSLFAYPLQPDGSAGARTLFSSGLLVADGLCVDVVGNVYVATQTGVAILAPDGVLLGTLAVPQQPSNCAFGGSDLRTLYITARTGLYSAPTTIPGLPLQGQ
jgi:gluconolactonase